MEGFASIASPLTTLNKTCMKFEWSEECERNFQMLKDRVTSTSVLILQSVQRDLLCIVMYLVWIWGM